MAEDRSCVICYGPDNFSNSILDKLKDQRVSGKYCDVILKVSSIRIMAHSNVLAAASPYFASFFCENVPPPVGPPRRFSQANPQIVELQLEEAGTSVGFQEAIIQIVDFIYTGLLKISDNNIVQILQLSKLLQMDSIMKICGEDISCQNYFSGSSLQRQKSLQKPISMEANVEADSLTMKSTLAQSRESSTCWESTVKCTEEVSKSKVKMHVPDYQEGDQILERTKSEKHSINSRANVMYYDHLDTENNKDEKKKISKECDILFDEGQKLLKCTECSYLTTKTYRFKRHKTCHTGGKYKCESCDFTTAKLRDLTTHQRGHKHLNNACTYCDFKASDQGEMAKHLEKHSGDKPYFCDYCDKRFRTRAQMSLHIPKHKEEKPFVCNQCGLGFKWKHALKGHRIVHTKEKNHLCDICGYATAHKSQLKAHHLIHTGDLFKCTHFGCDYQTIKKQNLNAHHLTHSREKPHQCDICGQAFSLVKNMRRHMLLHSTERPHQCKLCSFATTRYDKLNEHMNKTHNSGRPVQRRRLVNSYTNPMNNALILHQLDRNSNSDDNKPNTCHNVNPDSSFLTDANIVSAASTVIPFPVELIETGSSKSVSLVNGNVSSAIMTFEHVAQLSHHSRNTQLLLAGDVSKLLANFKAEEVSSPISVHIDNNLGSDKRDLQALKIETNSSLGIEQSTNFVTLEPHQYTVEIAFPSPSETDLQVDVPLSSDS